AYHRFHLLGLAQLVLEATRFRHIAGEHETGRAAGKRQLVGCDVDLDHRSVTLAVAPVAAVAEPAEPLADEPAQRGHVLGWPQILDGQLQEFGLGVHVARDGYTERSEEHTSELQSRGHLVCRLLLEK